jgi:cell division protein FtsI/penicillin-binding protein 2
VVVGHDVSSEYWQEVLTKGLAQFPDQPSILQKFYKGKKVEAQYLDPKTGKIETMISRARLTPYYFVTGESAQLGGVLATLCPQDKKKIHGMVDAILAPCATKIL